MATNLKTYDSVGGFSVDNTTLINERKDITNVNSLEIKNSKFTDVLKKTYILRGLNTTILTLDDVGSQIELQSSTINFITGSIIGVNDSGGGVYSLKIESIATCNSVGDVQVVSDLTTIIRDSIPSGQTWQITAYDSGAANRFSYSAVRGGTTNTIKWIATVDVISVQWS